MRRTFSVLLLLLVISSVAFAELSVTPYGMVQYRLRGKINSAFSDTASVTAADYANTFSYFLGMKANVDEQLSLQLQIGNDWVSTENVSFENNRMPTPFRKPQSGHELYVHLAYAKWNPGPFYLQIGAVPVISYGPLDLLERSLNTGSYNNAAWVSWVVGSNNSLLGFKAGAPILTDNVKLGVDLFTTIIDSRSKQTVRSGEVIESPRPNPSSVMLVLDIPVSAGSFSVTPQFVGIAYRNFNPKLGEGDHELSGGLTASYKIGKTATVNAMAAYAMVSNEKSRIALTNANKEPLRTDTVTVPVYDNRGFITGLGSVINAGPGAFNIDFKYSYAENAELVDAGYNYLFSDFRYTWNVHPKFSIAPRFRNFTAINPEGTNVRVTMENRPEILFTGSF